MYQTDTIIKKSKIPEGYKQTAVGVIPEDWRLLTLKDAARIGSGTTPSTSITDYWGGDVPWLPTGKVNDRIIRSADTFITKKAVQEKSIKLLPKDSIVVAMVGQGQTRGRVAMLKLEAWVNQNFAFLIPNPGVDPSFLFYLLERNYQRIRDEGDRGGTQGSLNTHIVKGLHFGFPPLPEQQKIATIFSTWDEAIEKTQKLIDQLRQRNKGLTQQLLTGKKRLEGFSGEWNTVHIYEVAKPLNILNKEGLELEVLSCTKYDGLVRSMDYFGRRVYGEDLSKYKVVPKGTFAYATNHIEEGSIGYQNLIEKGLISPMYTVFKTNTSIDDGFMFRLLKTERLIYAYQSNMSGSINRRGGLRWSDFSTIQVKIPNINEQAAIQSFLSDTDQELKLQEQKLTTLQQQKKGLMQKLLTGEIRTM